jgi:oligoribonuclease (3'-5' exoribonuclease)
MPKLEDYFHYQLDVSTPKAGKRCAGDLRRLQKVTSTKRWRHYESIDKLKYYR